MRRLRQLTAIVGGALLATIALASATVAADPGCTIVGTDGDDTVEVVEAGQVFCGGRGNDTVTFNHGTFIGGPGDDRIFNPHSGSQPNYGTFIGGTGRDVIYWMNYGTFIGGPGDDSTETNFGTFVGGPGHDGAASNLGTFVGGTETDRLEFNYGTFLGGGGADWVGINLGRWDAYGPGIFYGGPDDDLVISNEAGATFYGGPGNDVVRESSGGTFIPGPQ